MPRGRPRKDAAAAAAAAAGVGAAAGTAGLGSGANGAAAAASAGQQRPFASNVVRKTMRDFGAPTPTPTTTPGAASTSSSSSSSLRKPARPPPTGAKHHDEEWIQVPLPPDLETTVREFVGRGFADAGLVRAMAAAVAAKSDEPVRKHLQSNAQQRMRVEMLVDGARVWGGGGASTSARPESAETWLAGPTQTAKRVRRAMAPVSLLALQPLRPARDAAAATDADATTTTPSTGRPSKLKPTPSAPAPQKRRALQLPPAAPPARKNLPKRERKPNSRYDDLPD